MMELIKRIKFKTVGDIDTADTNHVSNGDLFITDTENVNRFIRVTNGALDVKKFGHTYLESKITHINKYVSNKHIVYETEAHNEFIVCNLKGKVISKIKGVREHYNYKLVNSDFIIYIMHNGEIIFIDLISGKRSRIDTLNNCRDDEISSATCSYDSDIVVLVRSAVMEIYTNFDVSGEYVNYNMTEIPLNDRIISNVYIINGNIYCNNYIGELFVVDLSNNCLMYAYCTDSFVDCEQIYIVPANAVIHHQINSDYEITTHFVNIIDGKIYDVGKLNVPGDSNVVSVYVLNNIVYFIYMDSIEFYKLRRDDEL